MLSDDGLSGRWWQLFAEFDGVTVVHVDLTANERSENQARSWLDIAECQRWQRFGHDVARRRFVLCRSALRALLCGALGCRNRELTFENDPHGKPFATVNGIRAGISFNVSHSGTHGMIALSRQGRVGVDVEARAPRRNLAGLIDAVLTPGEQDELEELAEADSGQRLEFFLNLWTLKEALSKAYGKGLSMGVSGIELPACLRRGDNRAVFRFDDEPDTAWLLASIGNKSFAAAVAREIIDI